MPRYLNGVYFVSTFAHTSVELCTSRSHRCSPVARPHGEQISFERFGRVPGTVRASGGRAKRLRRRRPVVRSKWSNLLATGAAKATGPHQPAVRPSFLQLAAGQPATVTNATATTAATATATAATATATTAATANAATAAAATAADVDADTERFQPESTVPVRRTEQTKL